MEFSAKQIATLLGGSIQGNADVLVHDVAPVETASAGQLAFICEEKYVSCLPATKASIVLLTRSLSFEGETEATIIRVENARGAMAQLLQMVSAAMNPVKTGIEQPSFISDGVDVPKDAYIGAFAYIGKNVRLGKGVQIYPHVYLGDNVSVGDNTVLYSGVKVYYGCEIGSRCILHSGAVIGADGFGFEPDANGVNQKVPQIGNVIIEDDIEIGANTTVDRAMMGSTRVCQNTKIDNLVQVAHNVRVGESSFLCAQTGIAGSTTIGKHCILAGQVGVAGHLEVVDNCIFGAQTGVAGSIRKEGTYMGTPAIEAMNWKRSAIGYKRLPDLMKRVDEIEKQINEKA